MSAKYSFHAIFFSLLPSFPIACPLSLSSQSYVSPNCGFILSATSDS